MQAVIPAKTRMFRSNITTLPVHRSLPAPTGPNIAVPTHSPRRACAASPRRHCQVSFAAQPPFILSSAGDFATGLPVVLLLLLLQQCCCSRRREPAAKGVPACAACLITRLSSESYAQPGSLACRLEPRGLGRGEPIQPCGID